MAAENGRVQRLGAAAGMVFVANVMACGQGASPESGFVQIGGADDLGSTETGPSTSTSSTSSQGDGKPAGTDGSGGTSPVTHTCTGMQGGRGTKLISLKSGGLLRTSWLHVPKTYDPQLGTPLVMNFHGFTSTALQEALLTHMKKDSEDRGFILAFPYGVLNSWNAGQCCGTAWLDAVDDVGFVDDLIDKLSEDYCIDPKRVYATGMSNGGFFAHRLGCDLAHKIAAVAPVAGTLGLPIDQCQPTRPISVLHFHGTDDPLAPYDGGLPVTGWDVDGVMDFPSVDETMNAWLSINDCASNPTEYYANGDARCVRWEGCEGEAEVSLCTIDGGGHTWPGGLPIPALLYGKTSTDLDANEMMLDFFELHPMQ